MKARTLLLSTIAPLTILTTASLASCGKTHEEEEEDEIKSVFFKTPAVARKVYVYDASADPDNDRIIMLESLQGILAQNQAQLYIKGADHTGVGGAAKLSRDQWFDDAVEKYGIEVEEIDNPWQVVRHFRNQINGNYIVYEKAKGEVDPITHKDTRDWNKSINLATTIAGVEGYLMMSKELEEVSSEFITDINLTKAMDLAQNPLKSTDVFNKYKDKLNNTLLINQSPYDAPLRDYAIASKAFTIYLDDEDPFNRTRFSEWLKDNSPILGWNKGELSFVATQSYYNLPMLAADHCTNLSFYSNYVPPSLTQKHQPKIEATPNTKYVAIVMSDGDNLQWMQDDFYQSTKWFNLGYHGGDFPITWTMPPAAYDLNPTIVEKLYSAVKETDQFIAGPSGFAYGNMAQYQDTEQFAKITAAYMKKCDLNYVNVLDYYDCDARKFDSLMKQDQVKGAVWSNRDLYMSGHGSVNWINDKPVVSMRDGLWYNKDDQGVEVHKDLSPEAVANRIINDYSDDIHTIDAYTVITANAWAQGGQLAGIIELWRYLKDVPNVKIVTVEQILQLINDNVPHIDAVPEKYGPCPDVPD
ncbi:MAG: hypothetical protein KBS35_02595 [Mycoplasma sp.]|nr:hypothetical protein [Candidatus Hennigella equi]